MKIGRVLPVVGILTLLACGSAFTQMPPIPPGAGVGVHRQPPGSHWRHHPTHHPRHAAQPHKPRSKRPTVSQ
jgi:hypothetical protein